MIKREYSDEFKIAAYGQKWTSFDIAVEGYTPLGVIGFYTGSTAGSYINDIRINTPTTCAMQIQSNTGTEQTFKPWVSILYIRKNVNT